MREVKIVKTLFEKGDVLVMGWKQGEKYCEWICELAEDAYEDEILDSSVHITFGFYTDYSEGALLASQKTTFVGGTTDSQEYIFLATKTEKAIFNVLKEEYFKKNA